MKFYLLLFISLFLNLGLFAQSVSERPNIVWLVTEDNSTDYLRLYKAGGAPMPQIETLAKKGVVFNNAFSNAPVCSVARSTIISGCYAPRIGAQYHRRMQLAHMPDGLKMFPQYLREAGYYTTNNSKEDYNLVKSNQVWDESSDKATYHNRIADQPFFHVQNYGTTHEGQLHFTKEEIQKVPLGDVDVFPYHPNTETYRYTNVLYRDLHKKVDQEMGLFLSQLEEEGLMENTIIFYYGDHGGVLPRSKGYVYESGLHIPLVVYVPEKWKHLMPIEAGSRTDAFVEFVDLAPTVLNLANIAIPKQIDGKPFLGQDITLEGLQKRNTAFGYADRFDEKYDMVRSIRQDNFKYIRNYQPFNIDALFNFYRYNMLAFKEWADLYKEGKLNSIQSQFFEARAPEALFDLQKDPHEVHNLANDPFYKTILLELRSKLQQQVKSMPDLSFYPEPYFLENGISNPVKFGIDHKTNISELMDIVDLSLSPFSNSKKSIENALLSNDPWKRYWGLIVCSTFGKGASSFFERAKEMALKDKVNLVRMRAIEFLALEDQSVSKDLFLDLLQNVKSESEANLILNSIALLKSVKPNFELELPENIFNPEWLNEEDDLVKRRIEFINGNQ